MGVLSLRRALRRSLCRARALRVAGALLTVSALPCLGGAAYAQEPPGSLPPLPDSLVADSLQVADSVSLDSLPPPPVLPTLSAPLAGVGAPGVWEWNRDELTGRRGHTVWELLTEIPGVLTIRSGDFGSPMTAFPTGQAGGGLKVYFDGVEQLPMEGAVPDLARVPISGLERIRVIRRATGLEVHLDRFVHRDPRAFSTIEAGTGDLGTNVLRAGFSLARALGGKATFALERLDTRGRGDDGAGAITGALLRYSLHRGDQGGIRFEMRRVKTDRENALVTPASVQRNDWTLQGLWAFADELHLSTWVTGSS
ncbi:MAG: TonB-dependent receptor plug domain-containing protein, partial [Longimicrobiales bacterium]